MQDLSYISVNQRFSLGDFRFEIAIYTFKNTYTLSPAHTTILEKDGAIKADCSCLLWAGGQEEAGGCAHVEAELTESGIRISASAQMAEAKEMAKAANLLMEQKGFKPIKLPVHVQKAFDELPAANQ